MHVSVRSRARLAAGACALPLAACVSVQPVVHDPGVRLAEYRDVVVNLSAEGAEGLELRTTSVLADRAAVERTEFRTARDAALAALAELRFRLMESGFRLVEEPEDATGRVELTLSGLAADGSARQAIVELRDTASGRTIAMVRARVAWAGEPAERLVERAARELGRRLWEEPAER